MPIKKVNKESEPVTGGGSDFPKHSLKTALRVALAMEEKNAAIHAPNRRRDRNR